MFLIAWQSSIWAARNWYFRAVCFGFCFKDWAGDQSETVQFRHGHAKTDEDGGILAKLVSTASRISPAIFHTYENKDNPTPTGPFTAMAVFMGMRSSEKHRIRGLTLGKLWDFLRAALQIFIRIWLLPSSRREFTYNALFAMSNEWAYNLEARLSGLLRTSHKHYLQGQD